MKHPNQTRSSRLKRIYGFRIGSYFHMLKMQDGKCLICRCESVVSSRTHQKQNPTLKFNLHVDHCHKTCEVRGLLCSQCNTGLGCFKDNTHFLEEAIRYLSRDRKAREEYLASVVVQRRESKKAQRAENGRAEREQRRAIRESVELSGQDDGSVLVRSLRFHRQ